MTAQGRGGMLLPLAQPWQQALLLGLLVLGVIFLFGGFLFGKRNAEGTRRMPTYAHGVIAHTGRRRLVLVRLHARNVRQWLRAADRSRHDTWLSRRPLPRAGLPSRSRYSPESPCLAWNTSPTSSHSSLLPTRGLETPGPRWITLAIWPPIGAAGWYLVVFRRQKATVLHWAAPPY